MYGYVYKSYCKVTDKYYIGSKKSDKFISTYFGSGNYIKEDIQKYGKDKFSVKLLKICNSKEELELEEKKYIKDFNAIESDKFYNIKFTSNRVDGMKVKEDVKLKLSKFQRGRKVSNDTKNKISKTLKLSYKNGDHRRGTTAGYKHKEESKRQISDKLKEY